MNLSFRFNKNSNIINFIEGKSFHQTKITSDNIIIKIKANIVKEIEGDIKLKLLNIFPKYMLKFYLGILP